MKKIIVSLSILLAVYGCKTDSGNQEKKQLTSNIDTVLTNIAFGSDAKQVMDIRLPKGRSTDKTKIIILIHGGAWSGGDKGEMNVFANLIEKKWPEVAIANINYRLANGSSVIHEQISEDLNLAVNYLLDSSSVLGISKDMAMIGASAGAHLSLLYAYKFNDNHHIKAVSNIFGPSYFADWSFYNSFNLFLGGNVKEVYKKYTGKYWDSALYYGLSPYHLVNQDNYVPTITFHGNIDVIVPIYQSQYFVHKLDSLKLNNKYFEYPGQGHGFNDEYNNKCMDETISFFKENMK
ncbi:MAG: alpha/beta hydrolase [Bacteroidetes bacterium]|nr:alpha/beta hydrolase [Bacteroidota bacterium]